MMMTSSQVTTTAVSRLNKNNLANPMYPPLVYSNEYSCAWPSNHRFPMNKFYNLKEYLKRHSNYPENAFLTPSSPLNNPELMEAVLAVHDKGYVERVMTNTLCDAEKRRIGLYFHEYDRLIPNRTLHEVGGTVLTCELALQHGLSVNLAGGTHHAHRDYGSGFCVVNDIAISASYCMQKYTLQRILIFDLDVHQGDGTASIFKDNNNVYTVSIHCQDNYPFVKSISTIDVGLLPNSGDEEYIKTTRHTLDKALAMSQPDLVIYDAGVDVSIDDALGRLSVTDEGIYNRDYLVLHTCVQRGIPVAAVVIYIIYIYIILSLIHI